MQIATALTISSQQKRQKIRKEWEAPSPALKPPEKGGYINHGAFRIRLSTNSDLSTAPYNPGNGGCPNMTHGMTRVTSNEAREPSPRLRESFGRFLNQAIPRTRPTGGRKNPMIAHQNLPESFDSVPCSSFEVGSCPVLSAVTTNSFLSGFLAPSTISPS